MEPEEHGGNELGELGEPINWESQEMWESWSVGRAVRADMSDESSLRATF